VLYGDLLACRSFDVVHRVNEIGAPAMILTGSEDQITPPYYAQFLMTNLGASGLASEGGFQNRLQVIPSAGHMIILEQPGAVKTALVTFLSDLEKS